MITEDEFLILDYLDIFKLAEESTIKEDLGFEPTKFSSTIKSLLEKGFIEKFFGEQWKITSRGENAVSEERKTLLERSGQKDLFIRYCEEFEILNKEFKELVSRWQMKDEDGVLVPNDHKDPEYDFAIIEKMGTIHEKNKNLIERISKIFPFYKRFINRFEKAYERLTAGEFGYMDRARDSYHNIWFELHESLLKFSGMSRIE
jgi:DNA-binding MarR family transcriptional regulator